MYSSEEKITVSSGNGKCNQVLRTLFKRVGSYTCNFYLTINFGSNHCGSSLHFNIMNDVSSAILDMDRVSSFTCHVMPSSSPIHSSCVSCQTLMLTMSVTCAELPRAPHGGSYGRFPVRRTGATSRLLPLRAGEMGRNVHKGSFPKFAES